MHLFACLGHSAYISVWYIPILQNMIDNFVWQVEKLSTWFHFLFINNTELRTRCLLHVTCFRYQKMIFVLLNHQFLISKIRYQNFKKKSIFWYKKFKLIFWYHKIYFLISEFFLKWHGIFTWLMNMMNTNLNLRKSHNSHLCTRFAF